MLNNISFAFRIFKCDVIEIFRFWMSIKKTSLAWIYCFFAICWHVFLKCVIRNRKMKRLINLYEDNSSFPTKATEREMWRKCYWLLLLKNCLITSSSIKRSTTIITAATYLYENVLVLRLFSCFVWHARRVVQTVQTCIW